MRAVRGFMCAARLENQISQHPRARARAPLKQFVFPSTNPDVLYHGGIARGAYYSVNIFGGRALIIAVVID